MVPVEESALGSWADRIGRRIVTTGPGGDSYCLPLGADGWGERYGIDGIEGIVPLPGLANLRNAATAHALLGLCGVSAGVAARSMASFPGTRRRLERLGSAGRTLIVSDYAHHPREMEASIQALRRAVPGRISVVFEPHLYSRTAAMHAEMGRAVSLADSSAVLPVYAAREAPVAGVDSSLVVRSASEAGADCVALDPRDVLSFVESCGSDAVVFMGAGDCDRLARGLLEAGR
ncbi:MAG: UDP-N-acetylmuramate--L-alanine ligase [candidate division Hyd24-12 bacterium ADurb.Bin004]|nr:MAG: UDP-N-acetylmuramate--L-alanine ligase [candidate division Hyd24-12 bacterium ADurb.Bin004]